MAEISQTTMANVFFNENVWISIKTSLKFVSKGLINCNLDLVLFRIMAWHRTLNDIEITSMSNFEMLIAFCLVCCILRFLLYGTRYHKQYIYPQINIYIYQTAYIKSGIIASHGRSDHALVLRTGGHVWMCLLLNLNISTWTFKNGIKTRRWWWGSTVAAVWTGTVDSHNTRHHHRSGHLSLTYVCDADGPGAEPDHPDVDNGRRHQYIGGITICWAGNHVS